MIDLGSLNYFLGIYVARDCSGMFLSQRKYVAKILEWAYMVSCNLSRTPADNESKLGTAGVPVSDPTLNWSLAVALQYLTFTRPNISYAVQQVCLYIRDPQEPHFSALKQIMRYVRSTLDHGLQLYSSSVSFLVAYSDANWATSTPTLSRSSAEAEYHSVANVVTKTCWLRNLLQIDIHFVHDIVLTGQVRVLHVPSHYRYAYIFTKGLPSALFQEFRTSLNVRSPPAQTARDDQEIIHLYSINQEDIWSIPPDMVSIHDLFLGQRSYGG
nr:ribonuclease H-like domain-containing protein [Tanacetum cinerariifolium]